MPGLRHAIAIAMLVGLATSAEATSIHVDFEGEGAACGFADTTALRSLDSAPGVSFGVGAGLDGGSVLNRCGAFGVVPRSGDHYLAFNRGAVYSDGGIPTDAQSLRFDDGAERVSIWASGGSRATTFLMEALGTGGVPLASASVQVQRGSWGLLEVSADAIRFIRLTETGGDNSFVFDDLSYDPLPEPATGWLIGLGGIALTRRWKGGGTTARR